MVDTVQYLFTKSSLLTINNRLFKSTSPPPPQQLHLFTLRVTNHNNNADIYEITKKSKVHYDSLRVLEWDKLCDVVSSFAGTKLGREATKSQLWSSVVDRTFTYQDTLYLLHQTNAAVRMHNHGSFSYALDFTRIDAVQVDSAIERARRSSAMNGNEALAVATMLQFVIELQTSLKAAIKEDKEWYDRFMPLSLMIMDLVANPSLVKLIHQLIDIDGSVKDSASPVLKRLRVQVRALESKLRQLLDSLARNESNADINLEVSNIDGRWCIKSVADQQMSITGLLMPSGSGAGRVIEPLSAVPLNDELQNARALVAKAEQEVLFTLTQKIQMDLDDINLILSCMNRLDVINARATYSLSFKGVCPYIFMPEDMDESLNRKGSLSNNNSSDLKKEWILYLPKAYHPLLLEQHRQNLKKAHKGVRNVTAVTAMLPMELAPPVPVDFFIAQKTRVLVITGPNTGGKTIGLKTIGLAAMMAKSGLYVLSSESVQIPWFDSVFADIGDEQSLSQSLSTFSGHLKQISDIRSESTSQSLVLLDEVGAGTNPTEGAALGMSLLESLAESGGALLTIATTHHSELKTLKYSNDVFENACMEFDEENLKPTYRILWGVPGRSNAINIAERLGLPSTVVHNARELYGAASAEINEVIMDMERLKHSNQKLLSEATNYLMVSKNLHEKLLATRRKIAEHGNVLRYKKSTKISEVAASARSILHNKLRQQRVKCSQPATKVSLAGNHQVAPNEIPSSPAVSLRSPTAKGMKHPKSGDMVLVTSLGKKAKVLEVEPNKEEMVVQAGIMKMKLKFKDVQF
ncbi:hypothetical protein ACFE04_009576 [Oxalis oulophora]